MFSKWILPRLLLFCTSAVLSEAALRTIDNPQGGRITFGPVDGQSTEAGAMGSVLRSLHNNLGDRPQVGKLFQVHGTQSVAAFFGVTRRNGSNAGQQIAGMLIVTKVSTERVEAAVLTDEASRFGTSLQSMMKALFNSWHPFDGAASGGSTSPGAGGASLHPVELNDRSASVSLPDGWKLDPTSGGGTIFANGPKGENARLGMVALVADLNNPRVKQTYATVQQGGLRNTAYAKGLYYPSGRGLATTFVDLTQLIRKRNGQGPASIQITSETRIASPPGKPCAHITGFVDANDGRGKTEMNLVYCVPVPGRMGNYMPEANFTTVPIALADQERSTLGGILASFNVNMAVVQKQANAYAAPAIEQIHAIGRAAANQAAAAHRANEIHNSSVYQHWDDIDRRSKEFSNYQLGYTVIHDIPNNMHGTFWNADADALVKHDPQRFEYVNAPDFWKGVDY